MTVSLRVFAASLDRLGGCRCYPTIAVGSKMACS